jgi:diketogulonate reductase-like aldo/keto reductase
MRTFFVAAAALIAGAAAQVPQVPLYNAAQPGMTMPGTGFGTGGYTGNASQPYGAYPECFNGCFEATCTQPDPANFSSCGEYVDAATSTWLQLGGRRIDNSASYHNQRYVGIAMRNSGVPRGEIFLTSKVGPYLAMGYNETFGQFQSMLDTMGITYVDLVLIHWPDCVTGGGCTTPPLSTDPVCMWGASTYNPTECRLSTWRALVSIWKSGGARAIGVSNFNTTHLQEIIDAGLPLPAVNQIPFYLYFAAAQMDTISFCQKNKIVVNGYSPFGVPDRKTFAPPMANSTLADPVVVQIAAAHQRSPAEIMLAWQAQLGLVVNPRSQNAAHMLQNLNFYSGITLSQQEMQQLSSRPQTS